MPSDKNSTSRTSILLITTSTTINDDHSHHTQSDHFEMDEDVYHEFRESMVSAQQQMQQVIPAIKEVEGDEKEGNLSRSPSCVMLFDEAAM
eukprot:CAMPEP_0178852174 /NCGR_PEP_ID=MMETSP0746-20121128/21519_1 /TAXON_ID=913974 /ORGANISM="Nitzschia punctata, Strain CCMP561" /LENGTH=90 /DNA_ID=CAMNT_0020517797 /DNA_START=92 /DNA_END=364 /DNA_ORIENTATION=+